MNRPEINITDAIDLAVSYAGIGNDAPCCVSAVYEDEFFALTIYTDYQKCEFYVHGSTGEIAGFMSEPVFCPCPERSAICA